MAKQSVVKKVAKKPVAKRAVGGVDKKTVKSVAKKPVAKKAPAIKPEVKKKTTWSTTLTMKALMMVTVSVEAETEDEAEALINRQINNGTLMNWDWDVSEIVEYPEVEYVEED